MYDSPLSTFGILYVISEWVIRILMLFYVPRRRSSAATRTWLLLIFFLPIPGLLLYIIIGKIQLPAYRIAIQHAASRKILELQSKLLPAGITPPIPEYLLPCYQLACKLGDFRAVEGNHIEILRDYEESLDKLIEDIEKAKTSVHLLTYIFGDDRIGQRFAEALASAVQRGVHCRLLIDSVGSHEAFDRLVPWMRKQKVEVIEVLPVGLFRSKAARLDLRNHRKIGIIDHQIGYIGSQNLVAPDFVEDHPNEEVVARVTGPVVAQIEALFYADHYVETEVELPGVQNLVIPEKTGSTSAQLFPSGPAYPRANHQELLVALIHSAREELFIVTPYFVPDDIFLHALRTARDRNVKIDIIVPLNADNRFTRLAQESHYEELLDCGIGIHRYRKGFLHAKHILIDHTMAVIGSTNIDIRSFALNAEASLLVYERAAVIELENLNQRYLRDSDPVDINTWKQRPAWKQVLESLARLADSLL